MSAGEAGMEKMLRATEGAGRYLGEAGLHAVGETWSEHTGVKSMSNRDFVYIGWGCLLWLTMIRLQRTRAVWFVFTTGGL